jgi:hypothetical protein
MGPAEPVREQAIFLIQQVQGKGPPMLPEKLNAEMWVVNGKMWPFGKALEHPMSIGHEHAHMSGLVVGTRVRPAAGTIFHTHMHDYAQLSTGLHGALIVVPNGRALDRGPCRQSIVIGR